MTQFQITRQDEALCVVAGQAFCEDIIDDKNLAGTVLIFNFGHERGMDLYRCMNFLVESFFFYA